MSACQEALEENLCQTMCLIRYGQLTATGTKSYKIYRQIFTDIENQHIQPDSKSVHYLAAYHNLVNAACSGELVIGEETPDLEGLEELIREAGILGECPVLQAILGEQLQQVSPEKQGEPVEEFVVNLVTTQQFLAKETLLNSLINQFDDVNEGEGLQIIYKLTQEGRIAILDPSVPPEAQLVCLPQ